MTEPTVVCPKCRTEIPLTESLAAPLIDAKQKEFETRLAETERAVSDREKALKEREKSLDQAKKQLDQNVEERVNEQLKTERQRLAIEEARKAKTAVAAEIQQRDRELEDMRQLLHSRDEKLAQAQRAQANVLKKERALDDARRELELTVETRVQGGLKELRLQAKKEAEDVLRLRVAEKDQTIASMQKTIEELKRKSEQGSQQLQGEVQELALETLLRTKFPHDTIQPVPKGQFGGDALQRVLSPAGVAAGVILWECKRTKNWSDAWLQKLRSNQRDAKAEISVLVSQTLPNGVDTFDVIDGVWVAHPRVIVPIATMLRHSLLEICTARLTVTGQQTKAEMVYQYLTGPRFRQRVEAIVEAFSTMQDDLEKERKVITKQWAKRSEQIESVMCATVGMYGDLQGIAGQSIQEIEALELKHLDDGVDTVVPAALS